LKPPDHFTSSGANTGNKYGLRTVVVPAEIVVKFLNMALPNTSKNVETCGILCGKMVSDHFVIT
jgi:STAM-binding protein